MKHCCLVRGMGARPCLSLRQVCNGAESEHGRPKTWHVEWRKRVDAECRRRGRGGALDVEAAAEVVCRGSRVDVARGRGSVVEVEVEQDAGSM